MNKDKKNSAGQGLIESIIIIPIFLTFVFSLAALIYQITGYYYCEYKLERALLCLDSQSKQLCENKLTKSINEFFKFNEQIHIELSSYSNFAFGKIKVRWKKIPLLKTSPSIYIQQKMTFPIQTKI